MTIEAREITEGEIDLRNLEYVDDGYDIALREGLLARELYGGLFLYSVFNLSDLGRVILTGMTRDGSVDNVIYAYTHEQLKWGDNGNSNAFGRLVYDCMEPAIAVYDRGKFLPAKFADSNYGYEFINLNLKTLALRGIISLILE